MLPEKQANSVTQPAIKYVDAIKADFAAKIITLWSAMTYFPHLFTKYLIHSSNTMEIISMYNLQVLTAVFTITPFQAGFAK